MQFCQFQENFVKKRRQDRGTVRVIVPVEDWFDVLFELYKQVGHSCSRTAIYREVRRKFANINRQMVTQFFLGCD
uniref:Uncharacterized protein n=1 Tax=Globodera rostochiensis TaxID=31243 RepID=A0A914HF57_GLORO